MKNEKDEKDKKDCMMDGCDLPAKKGEFCVNHYYHVRKGNLSREGKWLKKINLRIHGSKCKLCDKKPFANGYCFEHYRDVYLFKITEEGIPIQSVMFSSEQYESFQIVKDISNDIKIFEKSDDVIIVDHDHLQQFEETDDVKQTDDIENINKCNVVGCNNKIMTKGFCNNHYYHYRKGNLDEFGNWLNQKNIRRTGCKIDGCKEKHFSQGYCVKHYKMVVRGKILDRSVTLENYDVCKVSGCNKLVDSHGFCPSHANYYRRGFLSDNGEWIKQPKRHRNELGIKECLVGGCNGEHAAKGLCQKHYAIFIRRRNEEWIRQRYFEGGQFKCADCGKEFKFCQIDFHHIKEKQLSMGGLLNSSSFSRNQKILDELKRGIWICCRCHDNRHNDPNLTFIETKTDKKRARSMDLAYLQIMKKYGNNCSCCGDILLPRELEFHHCNRDEKESRIADMVGWQNIDTIFSEVDKCQIVCRNCHRLIHYSEYFPFTLEYFNILFSVNNIK